METVKYNLSFVHKRYRKEMEEITSQSCEVFQSLKCPSYDNAYIVPSQPDKGQIGGVFTENKIFVRSSALHEGSSESVVVVNDDNLFESEDIVIYLGTFHSIWGHALTDSLKKVWFLETETGRELLRNGAKLVYIYLEYSDSYTRYMLHMAGIDLENLYEIKKTTRFKRIYVPDNSIIYNPLNEARCFTKEYAIVIEKMIKAFELQHTFIGSNGFDKVYFSRRKIFQNGREWGENNIERVFYNLGYKTIYPETLSIDEQINILRNCSHFATTEGSISHSAIFCKPGTNVILVRKCNRINFHQLLINEVAKLNITYIDANKSYVLNEAMPLKGPFYMCITKEMKNFYGRCIFAFPYWMHWSYGWYYLNKFNWIRKYIGNRIITHKIENIFWSLR